MTHLVAVVFKKSRKTNSFKYHGGVLNPSAVHGQGYYLRRITGQRKDSVLNQLTDIIHGKQESVNANPT